MKSLIAICLMGSVALLSACSSSSEDTQAIEVKAKTPVSVTAHTKGYRVGTKDLALDYIVSERHGAAIDQGGYKHVIANTDQDVSTMTSDNVKYDRSQYGTYDTLPYSKAPKKKYNYFSAPDDPYVAVFDHLKSSNAVDYSMYKMGRWQRFCENGKNMDRLDWQFVHSHKNEFPAELKDSCIPPSYNDLVKHNFFTE